MATKHKTPLLDELEKGKWPSFVKEIKKAAKKNPTAEDLLGQLEQSYIDKVTHWKHGGIVGVRGYGGGVIGRYSELNEQFPAVAHFHTMRINQPSAWFYTTKALRMVCDIWDRHGSGLTNMHGSTGDMVLLGTSTDHLEPVFAELSQNDFDLGGSGSNMRTPSCCVGPARCEFACYDTLNACYDITQEYQDELHRPQFPYKFKFKFAGCANDCVASIARADMSVIGRWKDAIRIDKDAVATYAKEGLDIQHEVIDLCPTKCMNWDGKEIKGTRTVVSVGMTVTTQINTVRFGMGRPDAANRAKIDEMVAMMRAHEEAHRSYIEAAATAALAKAQAYVGKRNSGKAAYDVMMKAECVANTKHEALDAKEGLFSVTDNAGEITITKSASGAKYPCTK